MAARDEYIMISKSDSAGKSEEPSSGAEQNPLLARRWWSESLVCGDWVSLTRGDGVGPTV